MISIQLINDAAILNNFSVIEAKEYVPGDMVQIRFQVLDTQSNQRLIPDGAALMSVTFQNSDGSQLVKAADLMFDPDDKSCWIVQLESSESLNVVGGNFKVVLDFLGDGTDIRTGMAYNVLSKITFDGEC